MTGIDHTLLSQYSDENIAAAAIIMDLSTKPSTTCPSPTKPFKKRKVILNHQKQCLSPQNRSASQPKFFRPWEREPRNCRLCSGKIFFSRKSDLQRHLKTKHSEENQNYHCELCEEKFTRKDNLTRHLKTMHNGDNELNAKPNCRFCNKLLSRKDAVKRHEKSCKIVMKSESKKSASDNGEFHCNSKTQPRYLVD